MLKLRLSALRARFKSRWGSVVLCMVALSIGFTLSACRPEPLTQTQSYVFGTLVDISIYGVSENEAQQASNAVLAQFQQWHHQWHAWSPDSELSQLNQAIRAGQPKVVSSSLAQLLLEAKALSEQSNGLFNPTIGQLIAYWGFHRDQFSPVRSDPAQIQSMVQTKPSMQDIDIQQEGQHWRVRSRNPAVQLDLGGVAKGYALDQAKALLQARHIQHALVNIGGNILAMGQHGDRPWRVGIQHPRQPSALASIDLPDGWAIGTSGDYQRYFMLNGQRYCHIIDPRTGWPAPHTQAVTVLIPPSQHAGLLSDATSKPIFIQAWPQKRVAAKQMHVHDYMVVAANGDVYISPSLQPKLQWATPAPHVKILPP